MSKHQSAQKKRHVERQHTKDWWIDLNKETLPKIDIRTMKQEDINKVKDSRVRNFLQMWFKRQGDL